MKLKLKKFLGREVYRKKTEINHDLKMFFAGLFLGMLVMRIIIEILII
jgi:hypothetical protein